MQSFNARPGGVYQGPALPYSRCRLGRGRYAPLTVYQSIRLILDSKTAFDFPGQELSEYIAKFHLKVTDDVTDNVKPDF